MNNFFLYVDVWLKDVWVQFDDKIIGEIYWLVSKFEDIYNWFFVNFEVIKGKGLLVLRIFGDIIGLKVGLVVKYDILG